MLVRIRIFIFILMCIITAGTYITVWKGGDVMAMTEPEKGINRIIPEMDRTLPGHIETATFALG
jgi:hypothetical protein